MILSQSAEEELSKMHMDLCGKLNLDSNIAASSWDTFSNISKKFVLEGDKLHWLGCSVYVACRGIETPTLDNSSVVKGMGINLTSLLRHSNLSFVQFFTNISRWAEMVQLPDEFTTKINNLRSNFSVAYNTFKKFHPLFVEVFLPPIPNSQDTEYSKHKNRRNKAIPCTPQKIFEFIWNLFITLKAEEPSCSRETIKSHHLLYCCIDLAFKNIVAAERRDLINSQLAEELLQYIQDGAALKEVPCIVKKFCDCDSVIKEALHMKVYTFKQLISKAIAHKTLIADESDFTGIFEPENFDQNFRNITKTYETYLLSQGDFDERIFLAEFKRMLMEKEQTIQSWTSMRSLPPGDSTVASLLESPNVTGASNGSRILDTPLTARKFLGPRENDLSGRSTPEKVSRLHALLGDRTTEPSEQLINLFQSCTRNPLSKIQDILSKMKSAFIDAYTTMNLPHEEAQSRADFGVTLFYKYIELILNKERELSSDISALVEKEVFYQCTFACCLEIVLYCYNFNKKFPWILDALKVEPLHFVKVIELIVRTKDNLFRELIKHLNRIEETVLESLAWKTNSPIWNTIERSGHGIPKFEDTALPGHLLRDDKTTNELLLQSPGTPSATDCFQSPLSKLCRNLFSPNSSARPIQKPSHIMLVGQDGGTKLIPVTEIEQKKKIQTPKRTGSVSIIFRKFYDLAGVRMQHLCSNLGFEDPELRKKIWTIFEDSIRHTDLIKDRHLDQLLMCAVYVICKAGNITNMPNLFTIIMRHYRKQPQASSSVYRDVLIEREKHTAEGVVPEEKGDLIQFYNSVYVKVMQNYARKFQPNANENITLSPLPARKKTMVSPNVQVVGNVFVKPMETASSQLGTTYNYYFSRSPSKDLVNINRAINNVRVQGKRLLIDVDENASKKIRHRKLLSLMEDRQRQNVSD